MDNGRFFFPGGMNTSKRWFFTGVLAILWTASTSVAGGLCNSNADCNDLNPCTQDVCVISHLVGSCVHTALTLIACDDGNACTTNDTCVRGVCIGGAQPDCDDGNICTDDSCDPVTGCVHVNNIEPCSDGSGCTVLDRCSNGVCSGISICDDGNACTSDSCINGSCRHLPLNGACTDDGNACTTDHCFNGFCQHVNNSSPCNDGNACTTQDTCAGGVCGGSPLSCDDGNVCTTDTCNPVTGCVFTDNGDPCDDGDACTTNDTCASGACVGGAQPDCDDGNICTDDSCDAGHGCIHANNSDPCDDGDECTSNDQCAAGQCHGEQLFGLDEWRRFHDCYGGVAVEVEAGCQCSDLDDDGDVDLQDVAEFMLRFDGR